ncbi:IQ domain-containing protein IQM2 [Phytophthora citrophthora]|uniref:IQ domain-containing protein IQM2 n=1 Tax=Phytophthora citrophthora TaxID=4793 RepID=A0AAD9G275_9STRA|nr:IQ domain-containing protein IQM2 [Phytophthora citrophthora]
MLVDVQRDLCLLHLPDAMCDSIELVQRTKKTIPSSIEIHNSNVDTAARWQHIRSRIGQLTRGIKRIRQQNGESVFNASLLHKDFWLEASDPQHRYGFNLRAFHKVWKQEMAEQKEGCACQDTSFFHWLDYGNGKNLDLPECTQQELRSTRVEYCDAQQRKNYELEFVSNGEEEVSVQYATSECVVHTDERSKWIFVLDLSGRMYLGRKRKGRFHHSSFVSGGPILAAGKIIIKNGVILAIEPHSGHFKPRLENLLALCSMLVHHGVNIDNVAFIRPKKWTCAWPFPVQPDLELEDFAGASDTDYGADKSDSEEPQTLLLDLEEVE